MGDRTAVNEVNYQERAREFAPGDLVVPFGQYGNVTGRVTAVWPAIGMIDVEFSTGNKRLPVEDVQRVNPENSDASPPLTDSTAGGGDFVSVPGGPYPQIPTPLRDSEEVEMRVATPSPSRVAEAALKKALYWQKADRQYRATREECESGHFRCPKCKEGVLRPAVYKRRDSQSEKLLGCSECMFLVKKSDIIGHPDYMDPPEVKPEPFADRRVS